MNHTDLYIHFNVYSQQCYVSFCLVFVLSQKHDKTHTLYNKINQWLCGNEDEITDLWEFIKKKKKKQHAGSFQKNKIKAASLSHSMLFFVKRCAFGNFAQFITASP